MKNNNTAIFENSARRTPHFAVTSRWPDTSDSRAHEFMTPSWTRETYTCTRRPMFAGVWILNVNWQQWLFAQVV